MTTPRWPTGVPWEASSPTRSTPVRAAYGSDYGRRQYCLDRSGGWAWIRGKLQVGEAAAAKSTPSAPIPFLEASVWILRPPPLPRAQAKASVSLFGRRWHFGVVFLPEGVGRGLLRVVELLVVRSRREMACRWSGVASNVSSTVGLGVLVRG